MITRYMPVKPRIGLEIMVGNNKKMTPLRRARTNPSGAHMRMARVAIGVGFVTNRPSWKINGLGYISLGSACQFAFSSSVVE